MRIGIDITSILYQRGVSRYTSNLVRVLLRQPGVKLSLYGSSFRRYGELETMAENLLDEADGEVSVQPYPPTAVSWLWRLGRHKIADRLPKIQLFHSWDWLQPPDTTFPLVSTIHDLAILKFPETANAKIKKMHENSWKVLKERQAHIIAVSRSTKNDIVELLGYPAYMVHIIPEALPVEYSTVSDAMTEKRSEKIKARLNLTKPYLLFVGTREPRKNLVRLIQAWEPLSDQVDLLVAGDSGWDKTESLNTDVLRGKGLRFLGRVTDEELVVLYGEAEIFAYPSLYEGFGLPILEAFHEGTPVLTSDNSGMQEVAGNAAELIDPMSVESIRAGLTKILGENKSEQQQRLKRMIIRMQLFNWDNVAAKTVKVYQQAIQEFNE